MHDDLNWRQTTAALETGIRNGLHTGAQVYISQHGRVLLHSAFGEARPGVRMDNDTPMLWLSSGKPLTAVAAALLVQQGKLTWQTRVAEILPAFAAHAKDDITAAHLLTHTAGLHVADGIEPLPWDEKIAHLCEVTLPEGWVPGERAAYSSSAGWYLLGEIVHVVAGEPLDSFVSQSVCRPFGMDRARLCYSAAELPALRERAAWVYDTSAGIKPNPFWNGDDALSRCAPGGSARGPAGDLGKFYEALLAGGTPVLNTTTCKEITSPQRSGLLDETFQYQMIWGYGFILNANRDGFQMPYGYGRHASAETFGHSGNQSSCGFADPRHGLAVAWVTNGMPGERRHQQRQRAINNAIYADLFGEAA